MSRGLCKTCQTLKGSRGDPGPAICGRIRNTLLSRNAGKLARGVVKESEEQYVTREQIAELEGEMREAAANLEFERAAELRDRIRGFTSPASSPSRPARGAKKSRNRR